MVEMKGEMRGWKEDLEQILSLSGPQFPALYNGDMRASTPRGCEDSTELCHPGAQPSYNHGHVLSLPLCQPSPCLPGSYPRVPTFLLPPGSITPPSPQPGPWTNTLQLEPADCLLAPSPCSLPAQPHPSLPITPIQSIQPDPSQLPFPALKRQRLALSSDLQGWRHVNPKGQGSPSPLPPWPRGF